MVEATDAQLENIEDKMLKDAHIFDPSKEEDQEQHTEFQVRDPT